MIPTATPTITPTTTPSKDPTLTPTLHPTLSPLLPPSRVPSSRPSARLDVKVEITIIGITASNFESAKTAIIRGIAWVLDVPEDTITLVLLFASSRRRLNEATIEAHVE